MMRTLPSRKLEMGAHLMLRRPAKGYSGAK